MTRQEVINELTDIRAVIDADGELVAEDSLDVLATKLMEEGSTDISEVELDTINAMIYDSFVDPETICVELINMLMSTVSSVEEDVDPFVDDIWDELSDEEVAALTSDDGVNWAEYPDHEFQEDLDSDCMDFIDQFNIKKDSQLVKTLCKIMSKIKRCMEQGMSQAEAIDTVCNDADKALLSRVPTEDDKLIDFTTTEITECGTGKDTESTEDLTEEKNLSIDSIEGRVQAYQDEIKTISDMTKDGVEDDFISVITEMYEDGNTSLDYRDEKEVLSWIKKNSKLSAEEFFKKLVDQMNDLIDRLQKSETVEEAYYGKDSIIPGDIPGKTNSFYSLLVMRFNNMGYDEVTHPLLLSEEEWGDWNPFGDRGLAMFGPSEEFFDPIVAYIESEVGREDSAWYNRDYEVCKVEGKRANPDNFVEPGEGGPWALCIEARDYDRIVDDLQTVPLPADIRADYANRRKMRKANDKPAA